MASLLCWCLEAVLVAVLAVVGGVSGQVEAATPRRELVPAMFVFGDSLIDNGNNNNLPSLAKANYYPYGIDFNGGPTGRFSNGYTIVDELAELLGLPLIPAYSEASGEDMLHGVNYASAAAGILDITGRNFVGRIPFGQQVENFKNTIDRITENLQSVDVAQALARCLIFVGMGSNDYLNNYLLPNYNTRNEYNGQQYANLLVQQYTTQLTRMYNIGARRFAIAGLGLMGCIPNILAQSPTDSCSDQVNQLVQPFNANVKAMIGNLNANLPGAKFVYIDITRMMKDILVRPAAYGGQITCLPFQTPCPNRDEYVYWDAFHPTSRVNVIMGRRAFNGDESIVYPMNIQQLANLDLQPNNG
ncbi:hypothetical protein Nepgr_002523 [Nepenthes gracilis]|uniref:GDSL esterase/lipase n=1 Tax=Nepenthes gracilis TaxID=150966 RepID=A0AAD3P9R0_NEPGR|nr:hypothetical protein Nepgr_002523 [Nepenthes gracilis]